MVCAAAMRMAGAWVQPLSLRAAGTTFSAGTAFSGWGSSFASFGGFCFSCTFHAL